MGPPPSPSPPPPPSSSTNWLSFSLTPFQMFSSSSSSSSSTSSSYSPPPALSNPYFLLPPPPFLLDTFYSPAAGCWDNPKHHYLFTELGVVDEAEEEHHHLLHPHLHPTSSSSFLTNPSPVLYPKLEDFLNSSSSSPSPAYQPITLPHQDDSSFTHLYDLRGDISAAPVTDGFPASTSLPFNSNSGADESSCSLNASSSTLTSTGNLTLGVHNPTQDDNSKAVVVTGTCKRTGDSFGQRTSIYRGVTR